MKYTKYSKYSNPYNPIRMYIILRKYRGLLYLLYLWQRPQPQGRRKNNDKCNDSER